MQQTTQILIEFVCLHQLHKLYQCTRPPTKPAQQPCPVFHLRVTPHQSESALPAVQTFSTLSPSPIGYVRFILWINQSACRSFVPKSTHLPVSVLESPSNVATYHNSWHLGGGPPRSILWGSHGFQGGQRRYQPSTTMYKGGNLENWLPMRGIITILQSLIGGSDKFYSDTTKSYLHICQVINKWSVYSFLPSHNPPLCLYYYN